MKNIGALICFGLLLVTAACSATAPNPTPPATAGPLPTSAPPAVDPARPGTNSTLLYISATMHIESNPQSWPHDVDHFIAFLQATTDAGLRWSIGGDVGWLEGDPHAAEIIQRATAIGVQWDIHTHQASDRAKAAYLLSQFGVTPTSVVSGLKIEDFDAISQPLSHQGYTWTAGVVWGGVTCTGHGPGCDDPAVALYRPTSSAQYGVDNINGEVIRVGNTDHQLATGDDLLARMSAGEFDSYPIIEFNIMAQPGRLAIVDSVDALPEILAFVERAKQNPNVRFATIEETAGAWQAAGSVPVNFVP